MVLVFILWREVTCWRWLNSSSWKGKGVLCRGWGQIISMYTTALPKRTTLLLSCVLGLKRQDLSMILGVRVLLRRMCAFRSGGEDDRPPRSA